MRLNKYLSAMGFCSRREADRLIEAGEVFVNGERAQLGTLVEPGMLVTVRGEPVGVLEDAAARKTVLIAVNKPRGVVCTTTENDRAQNIVELVEYPERIYPVGRLDKDSEGLILMTNRGDLVDQILRSANGHEKEYLVRVDKALTERFVDSMRRGVYLEELQVTTRPCTLVIRDKTSFTITLTQGLNRQIRRMCEALGYHVMGLRRIRIMNIRLGNLKEGTWRNVTKEEQKTLEEMLSGGADKPAAQDADLRSRDGNEAKVALSGSRGRSDAQRASFNGGARRAVHAAGSDHQERHSLRGKTRNPAGRSNHSQDIHSWDTKKKNYRTKKTERQNPGKQNLNRRKSGKEIRKSQTGSGS